MTPFSLPPQPPAENTSDEPRGREWDGLPVFAILAAAVLLKVCGYLPGL